jgi:hypothetical protein
VTGRRGPAQVNSSPVWVRRNASRTMGARAPVLTEPAWGSVTGVAGVFFAHCRAFGALGAC